jgi:hypothetical protein
VEGHLCLCALFFPLVRLFPGKNKPAWKTNFRGSRSCMQTPILTRMHRCEPLIFCMLQVVRVNKAFLYQYMQALAKLCEDTVVLHADGLSIDHDICGLADVTAHFTWHFSHYMFKHLMLAKAINAERRSTFCFFVDEVTCLKHIFLLCVNRSLRCSPPPLRPWCSRQDAIMKPEHFSKEAAGYRTNISGITRLVMNEAGDKISNIWRLRQLTREELQQKVPYPYPNHTHHVWIIYEET